MAAIKQPHEYRTTQAYGYSDAGWRADAKIGAGAYIFSNPGVVEHKASFLIERTGGRHTAGSLMVAKYPSASLICELLAAQALFAQAAASGVNAMSWYCDCEIAIQAAQGIFGPKKTVNPLLKAFNQLVRDFACHGLIIIPIWVRSHSGIKLNVECDHMATTLMRQAVANRASVSHTSANQKPAHYPEHSRPAISATNVPSLKPVKLLSGTPNKQDNEPDPYHPIIDGNTLQVAEDTARITVSLTWPRKPKVSHILRCLDFVCQCIAGLPQDKAEEACSLMCRIRQNLTANLRIHVGHQDIVLLAKMLTIVKTLSIEDLGSMDKGKFCYETGRLLYELVMLDHRDHPSSTTPAGT